MLENIKVFIPWGLDANNLTKVGNPKIDTLDRKYLNIVWQDVVFFGGLRGSIKYNSKKSSKNKYSKVFSLYASINNSDFEKAVSYFDANICTAYKKKKFNTKHVQYRWTTDINHIQIIKGDYFTLIYITRRPNGI